MRLTTINFFKQLYPGNMYRGKKRYVKPVKLVDIIRQKKEFDRQEKIMTLLRNPYLSPEESRGHAIALGKPKKYMDRCIEEYRVKKIKPNIHIEDRLQHLTMKDCWD